MNNSLIKFSFYAKNWDEYSSQGSSFLAIENFWKDNWKKIGGKGDSYDAWKEWYKNEKQSEWQNIHKGPEETLKYLKDKTSGNHFEQNKVNRTERKNFLNSVSTDISSGELNVSLVDVKKSAILNGLNPNLINIANAVGLVAKNKGYEKPMITSAVRNPFSQVNAMANNWFKHGAGGEDSKNYLLNLYGDDQMALAIHNIFESNNTGGKVNKDGIGLAVKYIANEKPNASPHLSGRGLDFRLTQGIYECISEVLKGGKFSFKLVKESDHAHIQVAA